MSQIKIIKAGLLTTVQDLGRYGYRSTGISPTGVMDRYAASIANWLVGNEATAALLEMTVLGPEIEFEDYQLISICGGDLMPKLNGQALANWQAIAVKPGDVLSFAGLASGARGYLALAGGILVPEVLGSRSTHLKAGFGGFQGRALKSGDSIPVGLPTGEQVSRAGHSCPETFKRLGGSPITTLRVLWGPQEDRFTPEGRQTFITSPYSVTGLCDRMGFRLQGPSIEHLNGADLLSDANAIGTIQVTGEGQPILLMQDAGTTGGYTKIATVIGVDLPLIGQLKSGDVIQFQSVTREEARMLSDQESRLLAQLRSDLLTVDKPPARAFRVRVNGIDYEVTVAAAEEK